MNFVICCQDCNKHEPKIIACFDSKRECISYLNKIGKKVLKDSSFDIKNYKVDDEYQEIIGTEISFAHVAVFEHLYSQCGCRACCTHKGELHICCIPKKDGFCGIYEFLRDMYR